MIVLVIPTHMIPYHFVHSNVQGIDASEESYGQFGMVSPFFLLSGNIIFKEGSTLILFSTIINLADNLDRFLHLVNELHIYELCGISCHSSETTSH